MQLAQLIVNAGGVAAVVDYVGETRSNVRLPGIMMLGYVAAHSENLAMAVIVSKVREVILNARKLQEKNSVSDKLSDFKSLKEFRKHPDLRIAGIVPESR